MWNKTAMTGPSRRLVWGNPLVVPMTEPKGARDGAATDRGRLVGVDEPVMGCERVGFFATNPGGGWVGPRGDEFF